MNLGRDITVPSSTLLELSKFLNDRWKKASLKSIRIPWYGATKNLVPSPIIRVDMAPTKNKEGVVGGIYETEVRPGGLGVMLEYGPVEKELWKQALSSCRGFVVGPDTHILDDETACRILDIPYYTLADMPQDDGPYWMRTAINDQGLDDNSLVPVTDDGLKMDLVALGLAKIVRGGDEIDWETPQVFKPLQGTWCREVKDGKVGGDIGVEVYLPDQLHHQMPRFFSEETRGEALRGFAKKKKIEHMLASGSKIISQPFVPPERVRCPNGKRLGWRIWRLYYGYIDGRYRYIGGVWAWRTNIKVHGASDAVFGFITEQ